MSEGSGCVLGATEVCHALDSNFSSKDLGGHTAKVAVTRWCGWSCTQPLTRSGSPGPSS